MSENVALRKAFDTIERLTRERAADAERIARLEAALEPLLLACEKDCGVLEDVEDDEPVGSGSDGPMALTFGHMRRARAALSQEPIP